jgi:hypothetical protein
MSASKGYFSLVQYCPDIARQEAANVGVLLFVPELGFIRAKMSDKVGRIRRFFGEEVDGYQHLLLMQKSIAQRVEIERLNFKTLHHLEQFVATRANRIVLTPPKPVKVFDPEKDLNALFDELVADPAKALTERASIPLRERLDAVLLQGETRKFIRTGLKIEVPRLMESVRVPYAYQNERMNLIRPVEFNQQTQNSVKTAASRYAVDGLALYEHPDPAYGHLQLVVVADFASAPPDSETIVRNMFQDTKVRLFTPDRIEQLKDEIVAHGKLAPAE